MGNSLIEWTEKTWNPTRGCTKISPGCKHCYADTFAERWRGVKGHPYEQGFDFRLVPDKLLEPTKWKKPAMVFVNSMSDLFHDDTPESYLDQVFGVMVACERHTFQILTKRHVRMRDYMVDWVRRTQSKPPRNVWLGVSVENQEYADLRIPQLLQTPAAVRFLSCEPLLSNLELAPWFGTADFDGTPLHWVIVGGESGAGARPMELAWARSLVEQCKAADMRVFVKQLGANPVREKDDRLWNIGISRKGGNPSEWPMDLRVREFPR